jgi:hypothetical protein
VREQTAGTPVMGAEEFAELLGIDRQTLFVKARQPGGLPVEPIRVGRTVRFSRSRVYQALGIDAPPESAE